MKKINILTLDQIKDKLYGKKGTPKRNAFESDYTLFKFSEQFKTARINFGFTQDELAIKAHTSKYYISKIENDIKEVRLSNLQKIVELGFGGSIELSIVF